MTDRRSWWRRNLVGLCALVPVLAAGAWFSSADYRDQLPVAAAVPAADGWLTLPEERLRVESIAPLDAAWLADNDATLPAGTRGWQLKVTVLSAESPTVCGLRVRASDGTVYSAGPTGLGDSFADCLDVQIGAADLAAGTSEASAAPTERHGTALFLLPADVSPQQLQITDRTTARTTAVLPLQP